jgi:cytochrome P450 family 6
MHYCLFEIARNIKIQRKVQEEIDSVMNMAGEDGISYETLHEMKYLECCIDETLRKYPFAPTLFRKCKEDYKISGTDAVIPKNTTIFISALAQHRDPSIYDDPMEFTPERFLNSTTGGGKAKGLFYL